MPEALYPLSVGSSSEMRKRLTPEVNAAFHAFSKKVFAKGALAPKTKQLIAVAVAQLREPIRTGFDLITKPQNCGSPFKEVRTMQKKLTSLVIFLALLSPGLLWAETPAKPTDPQIAHIAYTAGQLDVEAGKQALEKSQNKDVRAFAQQMVGDHTMVNAQALALVKKLNVTPEDNPTSQSLTKQADATHQKLAGLTGEAFDKAYVDNEVAYHKTVNSALRDTLIPNAQNSELKALLQNGLKVFESHLEHAEHLAQQLSSAKS
jgi:putative membrane protein